MSTAAGSRLTIPCPFSSRAGSGAYCAGRKVSVQNFVCYVPARKAGISTHDDHK